MKSRCFPTGVATHIIKAHGNSPWRQGESERRLIALLDGALELERRAQEREDEFHQQVEAMGNPFGRKRMVIGPWLGKRMRDWGPNERRLWSKLTKSQVALWLSGFVNLGTHGGDRGWCWRTSAEDAVESYGVSRRMLFMALKLRRSKNAVLVRAVAEGGVSLGDAIAHLDHDKGEIRKAVRRVERKEARSLRQALTATGTP